MTTVREWEQGYKVNTEPKGHSKQTPSYKSRPIQLSAPTDSDSNLKKNLEDTVFNTLWSLWASWDNT